MSVSQPFGRLMDAVVELPDASTPAAMMRAIARGVCRAFARRWAVVWATGPTGAWEPAAWWPAADTPPSSSPPSAPATAATCFALLQGQEKAGEACLQLGPRVGDSVTSSEEAGELALFAVVAGRILAEVQRRHQWQQQAADLAQRTHTAEERNRKLTLRFEELNRELSATQRRQLVMGERQRIAQDLHDRAAQTLFLIGLKADWLLTRFPDNGELREELQRLQDLAAQGAAQTREAIYALRASELSAGGLVEGLRRLVENAEALGMAASLTVTGTPREVPPAVEDGLFKVAQEALTNARKHSGGSAVMVSLRFTPQALTLVVQDDGVGLPENGPWMGEGPQPVAGGSPIEDGLANAPGPPGPPGSHLGIPGMFERLRTLGGHLELENGDEGGTLIRATVPLLER